MKKIIFTANTSWYLWNFRKNTISTFIKKGNDVICVSPIDSFTNKIIALGATHIPIDLGQYSKNPLTEVKTILNILSVFALVKPDVIFTFTTKNNIYFSLCSILKKHLVVSNISGLGQYFAAGGIKKQIITAAYKIVAKRSNYLFFQNTEDMAYFVSRGMVKKNRYKRLFGSGVNLDEFYPPSTTERFRDEHIRFVFVARLLKEKGVINFIDAAKAIKAKYPSTEFHIYGPLPKIDKYEINQKYLQENVESGFIYYHGTATDISKKLDDKHCIVLPTFYNEGVPKTLIEGLAKGLAVITTRNGGCMDTVHHNRNGYLIDKHNLLQLTERIEEYITLTTDNKISFSNESRKLAEQLFDEEKNTYEYLDVINSCNT